MPFLRGVELRLKYRQLINLLAKVSTSEYTHDYLLAVGSYSLNSITDSGDYRNLTLRPMPRNTNVVLEQTAVRSDKRTASYGLQRCMNLNLEVFT